MSYTVAVRELCAFTAKQGDLDLRFSPSPSAQEGIAGHAVVRARRGDGYEAEISLSGAYEELTVRGRADGFDPARGRLEEIKTHRGELELMPANHRHLHWAQLKIYGHLLCVQRGLPQLELALVYLEISSQQETVLTETSSAQELQEFFELQCRHFLAWARQEMRHRARRDAALAELAFPYSSYRPGQRDLAAAVYSSSGSGKTLLAQAPTGIGKTLATLFPAFKALAAKQQDKVFFLTAKTSGRQLATHAMETLAKAKTIPIRTLELVARDKACEHRDKACHGQACPLAQGFFDKLPAARDAALEAKWDKASLRTLALEHGVCPYYLTQDLARWADVIIADYNYYFDGSALLYALMLENEWKVTLLVDEAHNLVSRAREMYSAALYEGDLKQVRRMVPADLKKDFDRLARNWRDVAKEQAQPYRAYAEIPAKLTNALRTLLASLAEYFVRQGVNPDPALQAFYFDALHFAALADGFGEHSIFDIGRDDASEAAQTRLCIRNVVPAPHIANRFAAAAGTVLFSATLSPWYFYSDLLGLKEPRWLDVGSPFRPEQLKLEVSQRISTRFRDRSRSIEPIVNLMARQYQDVPGNYLAFFSSFDYLQQVHAAFMQARPDIAVWAQVPGMSEGAREDFIASFKPEGKGIGFAVLGGAFGEGIDLPGARLIGAFIATLGLPQFNPVNEEMKSRMHSMFGDGYAYTYEYPGMQKVVQAAGRVIRTETDYGTVHLMDDRFAEPKIQALLPGWWKFN